MSHTPVLFSPRADTWGRQVHATCFAPARLVPTVRAGAMRPGRPSASHLPMRMQVQEASTSRRDTLRSAALFAGCLLLGQGAAGPAAAKLDPRLPTPDDLLVYMGAGCFWHVQHELIVAENKILGRDANTYTAVAGYAGGTKVGSDSKVCYHNMMGDSDYGKMGHTEVVAVKIPNDRLLFFMEAFLNLFDARGIRADPQDAGGEYRTALGLPGGIDNPAVKVLKEFASEKGMKVLAGKGNEPDTLKDRVIYVYDTEAFPFYPGELYHQYHNDMMADYGKEYRAMRSVAEERGALTVSKCPGDAKFFTSTKAGASMNPSAGANSVSAPPNAKPKIAFD